MFLQRFLSHSCNHCLYTVQTALNFAAGSLCFKITLIWLGSSLSVSAFETVKHHLIRRHLLSELKHFPKCQTPKIMGMVATK